jgi:hypothetical protein
MKIVFFKTPKPKQFNYKPIYYDAKKEALEERRRQLGIGTGDGKNPDLKSMLARNWRRRDRDPERKKSSRMSLFIFLIIILFLIYVFFFI